MMDEITALREAFGPDEAPAATVRNRARAALLDRMDGARPSVHARRKPLRAALLDRMDGAGPSAHARRWPLRVALTAAVAAAAVIGVVAVENLGTVDDTGKGHSVVGLPFPKPADAAEVLENAAWAAAQKPWHDPRPDQFMYNEALELRNTADVEAVDPNGPLRPGQTRTLLTQLWKRIDAKVMAQTVNGRVVVAEAGQRAWGQVPYADLVALTTPEKVLAWDKADKSFGIDLDRLLGQYVLPPGVEAAFFKALARGDGVRLNPDAVSLDGRPAIGLGRVREGYLSQELLFDKETYALIGERMVAIADHTNVGDDGTSQTHRGDLFRQVVYTKAIIVDHISDTQ